MGGHRRLIDFSRGIGNWNWKAAFKMSQGGVAIKYLTLICTLRKINVSLNFKLRISPQPAYILEAVLN